MFAGSLGLLAMDIKRLSLEKGNVEFLKFSSGPADERLTYKEVRKEWPGALLFMALGPFDSYILPRFCVELMAAVFSNKRIHDKRRDFVNCSLSLFSL